MTDLDATPEKPRIISRLIDLITRMPLGEQQTLLEELEKKSSKLKRRHHRKEIHTRVEYATKDFKERGFIKNISAGGVFIETRMPFRLREEISLDFNFPTDPPRRMKLHGKIVRVSPNGIGVEFQPPNEMLRLMIKSFLENF